MQEALLKDLLDKYLTGEISEQEKKDLARMLNQPSHIRYLESLMKESFDDNRFKIEDSEELRASIQSWLGERLAETERPEKSFRIGRLLAAASIILVLCFGAYAVFFSKSKKTVTDTAASRPQLKEIKAPNAIRATITLDNGKQIFLDNVQDGMLASEGEVDLIKLADGRIVYKGSSSEVLYNTLSNPKGSQVVNMAMSDGTIVFLDAGSSIRFPVAFVGTERKVYMTGQAWFDVKHNEKMPFKVMANGIEINDLGTQFNVNAFEDERVVRTTLLEGALSINADRKSVVIKPGQQGIVAGKIFQVVQAHLGDVMAWKNGFFSFRHSSTQDMMRQLSRWYDVEVLYEGSVAGQAFTGKIDRSLSLNEVLKILEQTGVHFKMEGERKIRIFP
jgi:ferric-dicitrate binding protein FerR (iron transport regulator)